MRADPETQRTVVRLVLERERELAGLERLLGPGAVAAVKVLAGDSVILRHGERLWASPCLSRLDELGLITFSGLDGTLRPCRTAHASVRATPISSGS
jgi:hypothetical protein